MAEEIPLKELDPRLQKQVENARKAGDKGQVQYVADICLGILQQHPGCLDVRKILHKARQRTAKKGSTITKLFGKVTTAPFMLKAGKEIEKNPEKVLHEAEKQLNQDGQNPDLLKVLAQAAAAAGLWETAVFVREEVRRVAPEDMENLGALGEVYIKADEPEKAVQVAQSILDNQPANELGQELIRKASVAVSMRKGKWEEEGGFREKLKSEEESVELEQAARVANDEETLTKLIERAKEKLEKEPDNIGYYREIAGHYRKMGKPREALDWIEKARELPGGKSDTALERSAYDLQTRVYRKEIEEKEKELEQNPDKADLKQELEKLKEDFHQFRIDNASAMVEKYPNDNSYKYDYGMLLLEDGQYEKAIQQFQKSQNDPKVRISSLLNLGRAYRAKKFTDLAIDTLENAKNETTLMNDTKKELIYELAGTYEDAGRVEEAIEEYKAIYAADIGYRDVADKVNAYYEQQASSS